MTSYSEVGSPYKPIPNFPSRLEGIWVQGKVPKKNLVVWAEWQCRVFHQEGKKSIDMMIITVVKVQPFLKKNLDSVH